MVRLNISVFILSTIIVALMANSVFATVTINTPPDLTQGSEYAIGWTSDGSDTATTGTLRAENNATSADTVIADSVDLSLGSYTWKVDVPTVPAYYHLVFKVGTTEYYSGNFKIDASSSSDTPATTPTTPNTAGTSATTGSNKSNSNAGKTTSGSGKPSNTAAPTTSDKPATTSKTTGSSTSATGAAPSAGGAQTLKPNLLNLCLGLGAIASVIIKYF